MDAKTGIVHKKEASSASPQPHVHRPSREEEGANQARIPPLPFPFPFVYLTDRPAPLRSTSGGTEPAEPRSRAAGRGGRRDAARPQLPFPFQPRPPSTALPITPPTLSRSPPLAARLRVRAASPRTAVPPRRWGGRKTNRCPARPSPSPTSPRDAPSPLCKSGRLAPVLSAPSSRTHRAAGSRPRPAPAARRWVKP